MRATVTGLIDSVSKFNYRPELKKRLQPLNQPGNPLTAIPPTAATEDLQHRETVGDVGQGDRTAAHRPDTLYQFFGRDYQIRRLKTA